MLILGERYGSIEQISGKSNTQFEYEYALEHGKPLFAMVLSEKFTDEKVAKNRKDVLERSSNKELHDFSELLKTKMVKFCDDKKDSNVAIHKTLSEFSYRKESTGWIRRNPSVNSGLLADEIARLKKGNPTLRMEKVQSLIQNTMAYHTKK